MSYTDSPEHLAWRKARENVTYIDGTRVQVGDRIRYHQAPGGLMPHGDWTYGVATYATPGDTELTLLADDGYHYLLFGHVIEPVSSDNDRKDR